MPIIEKGGNPKSDTTLPTEKTSLDPKPSPGEEPQFFGPKGEVNPEISRPPSKP